jgi:single-strand DNA-binding protein
MSHSSVNRIVLVGRLTRDPELRALPSGAHVCSMRVACNSRRKGVDDGEYEDKPGFFSVKAFGGCAEAIQRHMTRGRLIAIDGRLDWHEWEAPDGNRREAVEILADNVEFLGGQPAAEDGELAGVGAGIDDDIGF